MRKKRRLLLKGGRVQLPKNANTNCKSAKLLFFYQDTHGWLAPANGTTWPRDSKLSPKRNFTKFPPKSHRKKCSSPCMPEQRFLLSGRGKRQLTKREEPARRVTALPPSPGCHCQHWLPTTQVSLKLTSITKIKNLYAEKEKKMLKMLNFSTNIYLTLRTKKAETVLWVL